MKKACLLTYKSQSVGLGNFKRSIHIKNILKKKIKIFLFEIKNISDLENYNSELYKRIFFIEPKFLILDINNKIFNHKIKKNLSILKKNFYLLGIDTDKINFNYFNFNWISSLAINKKKFLFHNESEYCYGPRSILIKKNIRNFKKKKNSIIILTGSDNNISFLKNLHKIFEEKIKVKYDITIINGPYSKKFNIDRGQYYHKWTIVKSPKDISNFLKSAEIAISRYGMSYFEAMNYGCKTIVYTENLKKELQNIQFLKKNKYSIFLSNINNLPNIFNKKIFFKKNIFKLDHDNQIINKILKITQKI